MNAIRNLSIKNFTAFRQAEFEFSPGINVLIGENSTGKTHILKLIYVLKAAREQEAKSFDDKDVSRTLSMALATKFMNVFKHNPKDLVRLPLSQEDGRPFLPQEDRMEGEDKQLFVIRRYNESLDAEVRLSSYNDLNWLFAKIGLDGGLSIDGSITKSLQPIYLPSREVLSIYLGFIAAYLNRETSFDESYFDLCVALNANPLREYKYNKIKHLAEPLERILGGENKVSRENDRFYVELHDAGKLEANLVAEGYRKLATLIYLIRNGSLGPDSVLLWDEPEANLNPKLVTAVVEFLTNLAAAGAQIFIATHDYLLSQELSLRIEYGQNTNIKFFSLYRKQGQDGVLVESGESLAEIQNNPILDAFVAHQEREDRLFYAEASTASG